VGQRTHQYRHQAQRHRHTTAQAVTTMASADFSRQALLRFFRTKKTI